MPKTALALADLRQEIALGVANLPGTIWIAASIAAFLFSFFAWIDPPREKMPKRRCSPHSKPRPPESLATPIALLKQAAEKDHAARKAESERALAALGHASELALAALRKEIDDLGAWKADLTRRPGRSARTSSRPGGEADS